MTNEVKQDPASGQSNEEKETQTENSNTQEEPQVDYEKELESARKQLEKQAKQLEQAQHNIVELKKGEKSENVDVEEVVKKSVSQALQSFQQEQTQNILEEELGKISGDKNAQELIRLKYENDIKQSGYTRAAIAEDLRKAFAIVNAGVNRKVESETAHAQGAAASGAPVSGQSVSTKSEELSNAEKAQLDKIVAITGRSFEEVKKTYLKNRNNY